MTRSPSARPSEGRPILLIHLAIVSDQFPPTVIPALMHRPKLVVLFASKKMQSKAERLKTAPGRPWHRGHHSGLSS